MKRNMILYTAAILTAMASLGFTQEIDENALFGDTAMAMIDSASLAASSVSVAGTDSTVASFSGSVTSVAEPALSRDWFSSLDRSEVTLSALMLGDLMLDVRLPLGMKAFADGEFYYRPDTSGATLLVPELFLDANFRHKIYFRAGKQVLQWGRGYFWNPTDLVNVEKKSFVNKIGSREGTFGVKTHIPFGTRWNIYGFLDMNELSSVDSLAAAARFEGLFGGVEAGLSLWGKHGKDPIFGLDFSATVLSWSVAGEMSLSSAGNYRVLDLERTLAYAHDLSHQEYFFSSPDNDAVVRLSASMMRNFDFLDVDDRVMVVGEFYFNQIGDNGNVFEKYKVGHYLDLIEDLPDTNIIRQQAPYIVQRSFEFNSLARYYGAFFVTVSKFIVSDMTLQLNGLVNFNHGCAMLTAGVTYATMHNFSLGCLVTGYAGPRESEYTFMGAGASVRLTASVAF